MIVYHVSPGSNYRSIVTDGVLTSKAKNKAGLVWLCAGDKLPWAVAHTRRRHKCLTVVAFKFDVCPGTIRPFLLNDGTYFTRQDILWTDAILLDVEHFGV